jgi:hypothetical protein
VLLGHDLDAWRAVGREPGPVGDDDHLGEAGPEIADDLGPAVGDDGDDVVADGRAVLGAAVEVVGEVLVEQEDDCLCRVATHLVSRLCED